MLKLHGDAESSDTHILTQAQYADAYGSPFDFRKLARHLIEHLFDGEPLDPEVSVARFGTVA